ncbi:TonB-dependent receptor [Chryseobacterium suipulveris]|uniref:TonB-dependent receptor n=1 Tax=Chryseobacterium suipulveris TaxID=2929800 RepID=A0ABY4BQH0_9FLAO|nr:TonB-dependent receptor [Chryseobacterium suipulveris]UOE41427.1 TonB-dependent receptor [Chryseobacterium suipulveris]
MKKLLISLSLLTGIVAFSQTDSAKVQNIENVTVTKKVIQKKSDRLVFDVSASPVAKGNTAFNLLKETPLVSSTDDKTLKIAGKSNAVIFINGKKTQMNADAIEALLKNTPAENIQKIEVITLPGSEFNVESSDGIINIVLKKKLTDGANGNFRASNYQGKFNSQSSSASLNFRKNKWAISSNLSSRNQIRIQEYDMMNGDARSTNNSVGYVKNGTFDIGGYLNIDYDLSEKQTLGFSYNTWYSENFDTETNLFNTIKFLDNSNNWQTHYNRTQNFMTSDDLNNNFNLNYELKLDDKGSKINVNAAYLKFGQTEKNQSMTSTTNSQNQIIGLEGKFNQLIPQHIDNFSGTVDFTKAFKSFTLGAGGNFNKTKTDNDTYLENLDLNTGNYVKDLQQSNHFVYDEKISGLYLNFDKNFGEKISAKLGARMEFTDSYGQILGSTIEVARKHQNFLPTFSVNYNINPTNSISYSFTSRMKRPSFWEINPERIYLTKVNYVQNNPFMKASSVFNQELMYMFKSAYFLQISNSYTKDATTQVPLQRTVNGVNELRYIRTNYGTKNNFAANLGMNKSFFKQIWNVNYVVGLQINSYKGSIDQDPITHEVFDPFVVDGSLVTPFVQLQNTVRLSAKKDWFLGVNYFYLGKNRIDLGTLKPLQQLDINVKKIWNDWTFSLDLKDILKTNKIYIHDVQPTGKFNIIDQYQDSRKAFFTVTYNFGNQKIKKARSIEGAASEIKNRTGN